MANRAAPDEGRTLGQVLARAVRPGRGDRDPEPEDLDSKAAALLTRGYSPGLISQLSMRLGDVEAELADERAKVERGARRAEHVRRAHEAGRISALDMMRALGDDLGDEGRVAQLERQSASLRAQFEQASEAISPPERRDLDPLEAAAARAHTAFVEVTRARMAEAQARPPAPRPFASRSGAAGDECTGPDCPVCQWGRRQDAARARQDNAAYAEIAR